MRVSSALASRSESTNTAVLDLRRPSSTEVTSVTVSRPNVTLPTAYPSGTGLMSEAARHMLPRGKWAAAMPV